MSNAQIAVATDQLDFLATMDAKPPRAFGETYNAERDGLRIARQGLAIFKLLADGQEWTLPQIGEHVTGLSSSHSARLRQIREWLEDTGRGTLQSTPPEKRGGLWRYQIIRAWSIAGKHYRAPRRRGETVNGRELEN